MKKFAFFLFIILLRFQPNAIAQSHHEQFFQSENITLQIAFYKPDLFRVKIGNQIPDDEFSYMLAQQQWPAIAVSREENPESYSLESKALKVEIDKKTLSIKVYNADGDLISSEEATNHGGYYQKEVSVGISKNIFSDEHFFGFGERMDFIDQKGKSLEMNVGRGLQRPHIIGAYNILEANYAPVPFMMSTKGYGIFYHTTQPSTFDLGKSQKDRLTFQAEGTHVDYFFMYGPEFTHLINHYTDLTGKSPLLPRFAHGLHVGTYSGGTWGHEHLTSGEYVIALAKRYRQKGIPFDVLHLDSTWRLFGKNGGSGATSFEWRETFTDPKGMFDQLYNMDVNMVGLHVRPRFDNGNSLNLLDQAREAGHVYPEENNKGEFVNFFDEKAVDWWWENGVMKIAEIGAMFLKTDEGSAFGRQANESNKTGPTSAEAKKLHNVFPVAYAKAPFEKFKKHNNMRGMNHTREGYAGIQRYPFIWAGDWPSEWQYFAPVIRAGINIGLSGVGYWSHNMGGFEHDADPELFARWVQFGMFSPIAHVFGMDHPGYKEPWNYGAAAEEIFTKYAKLRYRLIPYIYSTAFQQHQTGIPIMRALALHHQDDLNTYTIDDQYYFGDQMIICPVTTKGAQTRVVYLPKGKWFDFWTGKSYDGNEYYNIVTPLETLPIFVKAGGIIPMQDDILFDNRKDYGRISLEVFTGADGSFELYEDDGLSEKYTESQYGSTRIESRSINNSRQITLFETTGNYDIPTREFLLKIHYEKVPQLVQINGKDFFQTDDNQSWSYDSAKKVILLHTQKSKNQKLTIDIK
ncbi:glycoside hydrolase family 31 protein [Belliella aquatica]|uniref:Alpha-glucosidase n=1 Tax=Belliella aquatica TaxID=1323734 RepID=A0ABQ1LMZ5_9BACT|nr:TIM-barrel domain-containing protein [Belliella aquatica]MCH7404344.1 DUF4968 domain-containing protein [Belliella aquatica]GGC27253.1 alpha-glucosidase [Belliella aquatica]